MRRLFNESIKHDWAALGIEHHTENETIYIPVVDMNNQGNILVLTYKSYPFVSPKVQYNGADLLIFYKDLFQTRNRQQNIDMNKLMDGKGCMCCSSLLCRDNWHVQCSIKDIMDEFNNFCKIKKRCDARFWSRRIASRSLVEDIPLHDYL